MNRRLYLIAAAALGVIASVSVYVATTVNPTDIAQTGDLTVIANSVPSVTAANGWINSPPLTRADLAGKVVLYDFWTYSCINCQRTLPHLKALYDRYKGDGLVIIGIHSPEFDFEKDHENVAHAPSSATASPGRWRSTTTWRSGVRSTTGTGPRTTSPIAKVSCAKSASVKATTAARRTTFVPCSALPPTRRERRWPAPTRSSPPRSRPRSTSASMFGGASLNASPEESTAGTQTYSTPDPVPEDRYALSGSWTTTDQGIESAGPDSTLVVRYQGAEVNLVAGAGAGVPIDVAVELDGETLTTLTVMDHDLYHVVQDGPPGYHTLTFRPRAPGLQAFAFTFGAGPR